MAHTRRWEPPLRFGSPPYRNNHKKTCNAELARVGTTTCSAIPVEGIRCLIDQQIAKQPAIPSHQVPVDALIHRRRGNPRTLANNARGVTKQLSICTRRKKGNITMSNDTESILAEVVSASLGGAFSASALYPLEVLKTRMQAETKGACGPSSDVVRVVRHKKCSCNCPSCVHCSIVEGSRATDNSTQDAAAAAAASATEAAPVTVLRDDSMLGGEECDDEDNDPQPTSPGMIQYARQMYQEGGIAAFYAGIETSAIQSATEKALYFFAYTGLKNGYKTLTGAHSIDTLPNLILGCLAEWAHLPVTLPIDCLTTKIQTDATGAGPYALLISMLSEKGMAGMYKGIQAYTVLCLKPAIQYTVFEQVKHIVLAGRRERAPRNGRIQDSDALSAAEAFFLGMVARTVATIICFPYVRGKVMLQSTYAEGGAPKGGIPGMVLEMFNDGGLGEVFRGIGPELTRGVLSAALMMMAKEKIAVIVRTMLGVRRIE